MQDAFIEVMNVCKSFNGHQTRSETEIIHNISLQIKQGEFITFFGPNGCGKTTLLNIIGGLLPADGGKVIIYHSGQEEVKTGYIFQNYNDSLLPWKTAEDNIAFPLEIKGISKKNRHNTVTETLERLGIRIPLDHYPHQLSGGQKQLTAIARALVYEPTLLLMDEPFAALDYGARLSLQDTLLQIWEKLKITILFVSHEIEEAIYLADKIVMLSQRPAQIVKVIESTLPRERKREMTYSKEFIELKKNALTTFMNIVS